MQAWIPFAAANAFLVLVIGGIVWYKFHRLRVSVLNRIERVDSEWRALRETAPPLLVGETFVKERLENIESELRQMRIEVEEIQKLLKNNGSAAGTGSV